MIYMLKETITTLVTTLVKNCRHSRQPLCIRALCWYATQRYKGIEKGIGVMLHINCLSNATLAHAQPKAFNMQGHVDIYSISQLSLSHQVISVILAKLSHSQQASQQENHTDLHPQRFTVRCLTTRYKEEKEKRAVRSHVILHTR